MAPPARTTATLFLPFCSPKALGLTEAYLRSPTFVTWSSLPPVSPLSSSSTSSSYLGWVGVGVEVVGGGEQVVVSRRCERVVGGGEQSGRWW
jgi:hypothetical protein